MQLGWFTHVSGTASARELYRDTIELAVTAEELGYGSFWVAQHHAGAFDGALPSPLVLLAAVAERTATIRLGTAVVTVPLEDPLRVAEDAAVVDELSGGRLQLGIGAGSDAVASRLFGRDHDDRHADCRAAVDRLCDWLAAPELVPGAPGLRQRLWWATGSSRGMDDAAERGMGVLSGRTVGTGVDVVADLARYRARVQGQPRVALSRIVGPDDTVEDLVARWRADPALWWGQELIVQTAPPRHADDRRRLLRTLVDDVLPALLPAVPVASAAVPARV